MGGGVVGGVVMDKIPHWLQNAACGEMGILNTPPPEPSPNSILQKKKKKTHSYSTNLGCEIPPSKIAIQMRCVYFCMAFEEKRGVVSLKRRKGPLRYNPPSFLLSLSPTLPFHSSLPPTDPHSPLLHARTHAHTHIFTIARWLWGRHRT